MNDFEKGLLDEYLQTEIIDLFPELRDFYRGSGGIPRAPWQDLAEEGVSEEERRTERIRDDDLLCQRCAYGLIEGAIADWWIVEKEKGDGVLPGKCLSCATSPNPPLSDKPATLPLVSSSPSART